MRKLFAARAAIVLAIAAGGLSSIGTGVAFAGPTTTVTCGQVITTSITVANDLVCASGVALSVQADGVTLDLGGHTIGGGGSNVGVEIMPPSSPEISNVTVTDGRLTHFASAVHLVEAQNPTLSNLIITANTGTPTPVIDTEHAAFIDGLLITGSQIVNNKGFVIFAQIELDSMTVSNTTISGGNLFLSQTGGPIFTNDTFVHAPMTLNIEGDTTITGSRFISSPIINNGFGFGNDAFRNNIFSSAATALTLADVGTQQVTGNTFVGNDIGVALSDSPSDTITGNTFGNNHTAGVYFNGAGGPLSGGAPIGVNASRNNAVFNGTNPDGLLDPANHPVVGGIYLYTPAGGNTVLFNRTVHNGGYGIYALPPSTFGGNISTGDALKCFPLNLCTYI